ncbi:MAG: chromate resistance protein [Candidatus Brocadia sp.]|uniref:Chromate resistance protein n=1 Tax=Candidatus Brocadia fulgida TaxID=380242 RepID=A0A0M2UYV4_9BACT|nr:MAG: chromate resistance protein [Candidatus Brocadia fulgida]UJS21450.1 MAG: chromate resistance protein [Candidatus Brocadia sp.]
MGNTWILFIHQIAQDAPTLRVKVWRNLKKYGAVLFKNAVYVIPHTKQHEEMLQWLCKQIRDEGSDASLFITKSMNKTQDEEMIQCFREVCNKEYRALITACDDMAKKAEQMEETGSITDSAISELKKGVNEILKNTEETARTDFFHAPQKERLIKKTEFLEKKLADWQKTSKREVSLIHKAYHRKDFFGRKWVTRKDVFIDRMASAWLIRKFIDPKARFIFLSDDKIVKDAIPFDMYGSAFTHQGEDCTFETLIKAFGLKDPALQPIAEIVHDIDLEDDKYGRKETEGIEHIIRGLKQQQKDDKELIEKGSGIFDALYQYFRLFK